RFPTTNAEPGTRSAEPRTTGSSLRVVLVGPAAERSRLRRALTDPSMIVAGEAATLAAAREFDADAFLVAADGERAWVPAASIVEESLTPREIEVLELLA